MPPRKVKPVTKAEKNYRETRLIYAFGETMRLPHNPQDISRAILSIVRALDPGKQTEAQIHDRHVIARRAFLRYLRGRAKHY